MDVREQRKGLTSTTDGTNSPKQPFTYLEQLVMRQVDGDGLWIKDLEHFEILPMGRVERKEQLRLARRTLLELTPLGLYGRPGR